jgi:hypothetical protein
MLFDRQARTAFGTHAGLVSREVIATLAGRGKRPSASPHDGEWQAHDHRDWQRSGETNRETDADELLDVALLHATDEKKGRYRANRSEATRYHEAWDEPVRQACESGSEGEQHEHKQNAIGVKVSCNVPVLLVASGFRPMLERLRLS